MYMNIKWNLFIFVTDMTGSNQEVQAIRHRFPNKVPVSTKITAEINTYPHVLYKNNEHFMNLSSIFLQISLY